MIASAALLGWEVATKPMWTCLFSLALGAVGVSETPFWVTAVELAANAAARRLHRQYRRTCRGTLAPAVTPWSVHTSVGLGIGLGGVICLLGAICWLGLIRVTEPAHQKNQVAQTSKSAPASAGTGFQTRRRWTFQHAGIDAPQPTWKSADTAGLETCATRSPACEKITNSLAARCANASCA